jgi:hypothetical protein
MTPRGNYHSYAAFLVVAAVVGVASPAPARDPESLCAKQDAKRNMVKPGLGFFDPQQDGYVTKPGAVRVATCELRANGRTIFQRYDAGKVVVLRGFFLQGKRSGRWSKMARQSSTPADK